MVRTGGAGDITQEQVVTLLTHHHQDTVIEAHHQSKCQRVAGAGPSETAMVWPLGAGCVAGASVVRT